MSKEAALAFLKHAAENAELQQKIVAFAAQEGYRFTVDELTDAELEAAAGGGGIKLAVESFSWGMKHKLGRTGP